MLIHVWFFVTPDTVVRQAPLSVGFSRQESWSGSHSLLQEIFPTQGLNPRLLHWQADLNYRQILYCLSRHWSLYWSNNLELNISHLELPFHLAFPSSFLTFFLYSALPLFLTLVPCSLMISFDPCNPVPSGTYFPSQVCYLVLCNKPPPKFYVFDNNNFLFLMSLWISWVVLLTLAGNIHV